MIVLIDPSRVLLADDLGGELQISTESSLQFRTDPLEGPQQTVSLWQNGLRAVKFLRTINWKPLTGSTFVLDQLQNI